MNPGQRRVIWACIFAMTFVFWYEASGVPLVWQENIPEPLQGREALRNYWDNFGYGFLFLLLGAVLTFVLQHRGVDEKSRYHAIDWVALSIGLGMLAGTAWRSYAALGSGAMP